MSTDAALDVGLSSPLDVQGRSIMVNRIWGRALTQGEYHREWHQRDNPFFAHYEGFVNLALDSRHGETLRQQTLRDLICTVEQIRDSDPRGAVRQEVLKSLSRGCKDHSEECEEAADSFLALAVRTLLMCNIGVIGDELQHERHLSWDDGTIPDLMKKDFTRGHKLKEIFRLEKAFQARNLERLGGIEVLWTENLLEHLRLYDPSDESGPYRLSIFYHAGFLEHHRDAKSKVFPEGLVEETLRTLALLFPRYDAETQRWFAKQCAKCSLDPLAAQCTPLEPEERTIESFAYWRDRLTILKQSYDESEPKTMTQWWQDRRKRVQWATFWTAAVVLALTVL